MRRDRPRRGGVATASRDRWVISYADFITLLFAFFTTLYAASTVDTSHWSTVAAGLSGGLNRAGEAVSKNETPAISGDGVLQGGRGVTSDGLPHVKTELQRELGDILKTQELRLTSDRRGLVLSIPEAGAFPVGSADISPQAHDLIARIAHALERLPNAVRVEGHTDGTPIHTPRFASNWELSTARATSVVEYLIERGGIAPVRLSAAGYAEFHPLAEDESPENRARNRRVDIVILNSATQTAEEPSAQNQR